MWHSLYQLVWVELYSPRTQVVLDNFGVWYLLLHDKGYVSVNGNDRVNPEGWYSVVAGGYGCSSVLHLFRY